jgi:hypothetical protein
MMGYAAQGVRIWGREQKQANTLWTDEKTEGRAIRPERERVERREREGQHEVSTMMWNNLFDDNRTLEASHLVLSLAARGLAGKPCCKVRPITFY